MDAFARRDSLTEWSSLLSRTSPGAQAWTRSLGVRLPSSARPGPPPACQGDRPTPPASWLGCRAGAQEARISGGDPHQRQQEPSLSSDSPQGELSQGAKGDSGEVSKGTRGFADRT